LSGADRVAVQVNTWTAQFVDETGEVRRFSTKTAVRSVAEKILAQYEKEVERIKSGVITRAELDKAQIKQMPLMEMMEQFRSKMIAEGTAGKHASNSLRRINKVFQQCRIECIADIRREPIERWLADVVENQIYAANTINSYIASIKAFAQYLTDLGIFTGHPLRTIRPLNSEVDRRIKRRALTKSEIVRLLDATANGIDRAAGSAADRVLIYRLLLGTGLRSTELSLLTPSQIIFDHCRLRIEASNTKNKKADILPLRANLVQALKERMERMKLKPLDRFFHHNSNQIRESFYADLREAGIERKGLDERNVDVHSLRKTFGTLLAMSGVPLTTVQRLMRHSTPILTAKLYIDVDSGNMSQALEQLPDF
jgi:integrase